MVTARRYIDLLAKQRTDEVCGRRCRRPILTAEDAADFKSRLVRAPSAMMRAGRREPAHFANGAGLISSSVGDFYPAVERLDLETLFLLLRSYETALAELRAFGDPGVAELIGRMERDRAEVVAALAARRANLARPA